MQGESIEHFHPAGANARGEADRWNGLKQLSLDLTMGHELAPGMARYLHDNGVNVVVAYVLVGAWVRYRRRAHDDALTPMTS